MDMALCIPTLQVFVFFCICYRLQNGCKRAGSDNVFFGFTQMPNLRGREALDSTTSKATISKKTISLVCCKPSDHESSIK